jgi:alpha-beta hydrolase superfamily lysophospholipase
MRQALLAVAVSLLLVVPEGAAGRSAQRVTFRTDDGVTLWGTWYEPSTRLGPAVILVHMLQRSRRDWEGLAPRLAEAGIGALAFDLRGHGESTGSADSLRAMVGDITAARRFVATRFDVVQGRVGLLGASLGANLAALEAADDPGVVSLALLSPSLDYRGLRIEAAMRKYGNRPALLVASDDDPYAQRSVRDLQKGASGREVMRLSGAGHGTMMLLNDSGLSGVLVDWFRRTLL